MIIHYINLDSATARHESITHNFAAVRTATNPWALSRFAAISAQHEQIKTVAGSRSDTEKACFLSHHSLVMQACSSDDYHWIVEDDIHFSPAAFGAVASFIGNPNNNWDILFTDITIRSFTAMVDLFEGRKKIPPGSVTYINVGTCPVCSAVSYIINPKSKTKIANVLRMPEAINTTWDIFLADAIQTGKLTAYFTFPYVTTFSPLAFESQIRTLDNDIPGILGRAFRSLMTITPDMAMATKLLSQIDNTFVDERAACFGKIISGFVAEKFPKE